MKKSLTQCFPLLSLLCTSLLSSALAQTNTEGGVSLTFHAKTLPGEKDKPALFFSTSASITIAVARKTVDQTITLQFRVLQGEAETLSVGLHGACEVTSVTGAGLASWALRQPAKAPANHRMLDLRPANPAKPGDLKITVKLRQQVPKFPAERIDLATLAPGDAVGFLANTTLHAGTGTVVRVLQATHLSPLGEPDKDGKIYRFQTAGASQLAIAIDAPERFLAPIDMRDLRIEGVLDPDNDSASFTLTGTAHVRAEDPIALDILTGNAAISAPPASKDFRLKLRSNREKIYQLHFEKPGEYPVNLKFNAQILRTGDSRSLLFAVPAGAVVPVILKNLEKDVELNRQATVVPRWQDEAWQGFLPANGICHIDWKPARAADAEGALFFTSSGIVDVRVGAGLLRQTTDIDLQVLQGRLSEASFEVQGDGEILSVQGVVEWKPVEEGGKKLLQIKMARPLEGTGRIRVDSQAPLGDFPVEVTPLRLIPQTAVRHSGSVRVSNIGSVRLEVKNIEGMTQLAPNQFPGPAIQGKHVFVYRFPSAVHGYTVSADAIVPEVGLSQITRYHIGEADRILSADIELDIREAPIREFPIDIPEGYSVAEVQGEQVGDHNFDTASRRLTVFFKNAIQGRHRVVLRLEKTEPAAAGNWELPPLGFPDVKTLRGHIGVTATAGYRLSVGESDGLAEVPLAYFPTRVEGLQQAFRIKNGPWTATIAVEELGQHVDADAFHLYSLTEGVAYGSVLLNFYVVGSPVSEWLLHVPTNLGHVTVDGQDVRSWQRSGETVTVDLNQPALGAHTLLVTFEQPMPGGSGDLLPGRLHPLDVKSERGVIQITSPQQVRHTVKSIGDDVLKLENLELAPEFRILAQAPSLGVFQYTARPFDLELGVEWLEPGKTVDQLVDFADFTSGISRDGEAVTEARLFVKTRGRKALRMRLPSGLILWDVHVAGEATSVRADGEDTLIPLPTVADPNTPIEVTLRLGSEATSVKNPVLHAPRLAASTLVAQWHVSADPGRHLVPGDGVETVKELRGYTGFRWLQMNTHHDGLMWLCGILLVGMILRLRDVLIPRAWSRFLSALCFIAALVLCLLIARDAWRYGTFTRGQFDLVTPIITADEPVSMSFRHIPEWRALLSFPGLLLIGLGGLTLLMAGAFAPKKRFLSVAFALTAIAIGLLCQYGGAVWFFSAVALLLLALFVVPDFLLGWRGGKTLRERHRERKARAALEKESDDKDDDAEGDGDGEEKPEPDTPPSGSPVVPALILTGALLGGLFQSTPAEAKGKPAPPPAQTWPACDAMDQTIRIEENRLYASVKLQLSGKVGDASVLLVNPAVLTQFKSEGIRVVRHDNRFLAVLEKEGAQTGSFDYELALPNLPGEFNLPTGPAAVHRVHISTPQVGWEFHSEAAVKREVVEGGEGSAVKLVLRPLDAVRIQVRPRARDIDSEDTRFFAEVGNLFIPGPGVVDALHKVQIRPSLGRVGQLTFTVPDGFTVSEVTGPVRLWQYDPTTHSLRVSLEPAQSSPFTLIVQAQRGAGALPFDLEVAPLQVIDSAGGVGMIGLGFGNSVRAASVEAEGLSAVNVTDFDASLVPKGIELRRVFRYNDESKPVKVSVAAVLPEVRAVWSQKLSVSSERTVLGATLHANVLRAGVFKLGFKLPKGFDVESLSGESLQQWTETEADGERQITLHLNGSTMGQQSFAVTLVSTGITSQAAWELPRLHLDEARRETGQLVVVPDQGIRLHPVERSNVSLLDARAVGARQNGALAFKLLQADWSLKLAVEELDPWITGDVLQEITLREGRIKTRHSVLFRVRNAAIKKVRIILPGMDASEIESLRASGDAVSDLVKVSDMADAWDIQFRRRVIGTVPVTVEHQRVTTGTNDLRVVRRPSFPELRQWQTHVALRTTGRLELQLPENLPAGWRSTEWNAVPAGLRTREKEAAPVACLRVVEPAEVMPLLAVRHDVADTLKMRILSSRLVSVFSSRGSVLTSMQLEMKVAEKSNLRIELPEGAELYNVFVNGESAAVVREDDVIYFHVETSPFEIDHPAGQQGGMQQQAKVQHDGGVHTEEAQQGGRSRATTVSLAYAQQGRGKKDLRPLDLTAPGLQIPLENLRWRVVVPEGMKVSDHDGDLELVGQVERTRNDLSSYINNQEQLRSQRTQQAEQLLQTAQEWLQAGEQEKALKMLDNIAFNQDLDQASNEDARVQLRELQTRQAVLGLNTRRQKLTIENYSAAGKAPDQQLEEAARRNPLMQGKLQYRPEEFDSLLAGNTAEEIASLRRLAYRLIGHQLTGAPAPQSLTVNMNHSGDWYEFARNVQVDGDEALELELKFAKVRTFSGWGGWLIALGVTAFVLFALWLRRRSMHAHQN